MRRTFGCIAVLLLLATACEMRAEVRVNEDGSGTFAVVFGIERTLMKAFPPGTDSPLTMFKEELERSEVPWAIRDFTEPRLQGIRASLPFGSVEELREQLKTVGEADSGIFGSGGSLDESVVIERIDKGWSFRSRGLTPAAKDVERNGETGFKNPFEGSPLAENFEDGFRVEFHVTLPGEPLEHNATEVATADDSSTFIWRTHAFEDKAVALRAQTQPPAPTSPVLPALGIVAVIGGTVFLLKRDRAPRSVGPPPVVLEGMPVVGELEPVGAPGDGTSEDLLGELP